MRDPDDRTGAGAKHPRASDTSRLRAHGLQLLRQGRHLDAERLLRRVMQLAPEEAGVYVEACVALEQAGQPEFAWRCLHLAMRSAPAEAVGWLRAGELLKRRGKLVEAEPYLRRAMELGPRNLPAYISCAAALADAGQVDAALGCLERVERVAPDDSAALLECARLRVACGDLAGAASLLSELKRLGTPASSVRAQFAAALLRQGDESKAFELLGASLESVDDDPSALITVAALYQRRGLLPEAERLFRAAAQSTSADRSARWQLVEFLKDCGRYPEAVRCARDVLRAFPDDATVNYGLGRLYGKMGRYALMRGYYRRFLHFPRSPEEGRFDRLAAQLCVRDFDGAVQTAEAMLDAGCPDDELEQFVNLFPWSWFNQTVREANGVYLEALRQWQRRGGAAPWCEFFQIGILRHTDADTDDAGRLLVAFAVQDKQRHGWMQYWGGLWRLFARRYTEAFDDFSVATRSRPRFWLAHCRTAEALACLGQPQAAFAIFDQFLEDPQAPSRGDVEGWYGEVLLWTGRYEDALLHLDAAVNQGAWLAVCWRGAANLMLGRYNEARADLDRAIVNGPNDAEAFTWRGELFRRLGRWEEARIDLNRAIELGSLTWPYINLALVHAAVGDNASMRADLSAVPPKTRAALAALTGWDNRKPGSDADLVRTLEKGLELGLGVRRNEAYLDAIWAPTCRESRNDAR